MTCGSVLSLSLSLALPTTSFAEPFIVLPGSYLLLCTILVLSVSASLTACQKPYIFQFCFYHIAGGTRLCQGHGRSSIHFFFAVVLPSNLF